MTNKKILITGGNGYIASSLNNSLKSKYNIIAPNKHDLNLLNEDSIKYFFDKNQIFDCVVHCAITGGSRLKKDDWNVLDSNLQMYYNLCKKEKFFKKFINFGSGAEIYDSESPYGLSKKVISKSISEKQNYYNIRIFNVFGYNELPTRFIKKNIINYINKKNIEVYENKKMDFFYIDDLINTVEFYINNNNLAKEINCSYKEKYCLFEVANLINNLNDHKVQIHYENIIKPDYVGEFNLPISYIGLQNGIKNTYDKLK
jgi:nucleoside-diphosphate-sugar epimerase